MANLFIDVLRSYTLAGKFKVHDFVVMQNHVHFLVTVDGEMSVEKAVQLVKGNFSFRAKKEKNWGSRARYGNADSPMCGSRMKRVSGFIRTTFTRTP